MVTVDLIVVSVMFLVSCYRFRADALNETAAPPALLHFIDLTAAISACAIALVGLPGSQVTFGAVPAWLVAVGPPLIVATMVFVLRILRRCGVTPRWAACVLAAGIAGLLVGPAKIVLAAILTPVVDLLPFPDFGN